MTKVEKTKDRMEQWPLGKTWGFSRDLDAYTAAVREDERERCAKIAEYEPEPDDEYDGDEYVATCRATGSLVRKWIAKAIREESPANE